MRRDLFDVADRRFTCTWNVMRYNAENLGGGWAKMWEDGAGDIIRQGHAWLRHHRSDLERALIS